MNNTYLLGGELALFAMLSVVNFDFLINNSLITAENNVILQIGSTVAVAASAVPIGYIVNQIWMTIYNLFFDVHNYIFTVQTERCFVRELKRKWHKSNKWNKGTFLEIKLALIHRKNAEFSSEAWLSWHRNRLNQLHSNGSIITAFFLSSLLCLLISSFTSNDLFIHPLSLYFQRRWWAMAFVILASICCVVNARRAFKMLVIYNKSAIYEICNCNCKHTFKCKYYCNFK